MRFLIDAQLPPVLARWITGRGHGELNGVVFVRLRADPSFRGGAAEPGIQSGEERGFAPRFATATRSKSAIPAKSP